MIPRIKIVEASKDYKLHVIFDDGKEVLYDVAEDVANLPGYADLKSIAGLFEQVQLDDSRTCVFWTEDIDLPSDTIYEYGASISDIKKEMLV